MATCTIDKKSKSYKTLESIVGADRADESIKFNNSMGMEFDKNGLKSILFTDIMEKFSGDTSSAYRVKAKYLSEGFRKENEEWLKNLKDSDFYPDTKTGKVDRNTSEIRASVLLERMNQKYGGFVSKTYQNIKNKSRSTLLGLEEFEKRVTKQFKEQKNLSNPEKLLEYIKTKSQELYDSTTISKDAKTILFERYKEMKEKLASVIDPYGFENTVFMAIDSFSINTGNILKKAENVSIPIEAYLDDFLKIGSEISFLSNLLEKTSEATVDTTVSKTRAFEELQKIKKDFDGKKDAVVIRAVKKMATETGINQESLADIIEVYEENGITKERVKILTRDSNIYENVSRWMRNNLTDMTKSNNTLVQLLGITAVLKNSYYVNNMNLKLDQLSEVLSKFNEAVGEDPDRFLIFYKTHKDKDGKTVYENELINKYEPYSLKDHKKAIKGKTMHQWFEYLNENTNLGINATTEEDKAEFKKAFITQKAEWELQEAVLKEAWEKDGFSMYSISGKMYADHLEENPEIFRALFEKWMENKSEDTIKLNYQSVIDSLYSGKDLEIYNKSSKAKGVYRHIDKYLPVIGSKKTAQYNQFMAKYASNPAVMNFYTFLLDTIQENQSLMPQVDENGDPVGTYDLFESQKTIDEQMAEAGGFWAYTRLKTQENWVKAITEKSVLPHRKEFNIYTGKYEKKIQAPLKAGRKSFDSISKDLGSTLAQHIVLANTFAYKAETEPFVNMTLNYLENTTVLENGVVMDKKLDEEYGQVDSFANQFLYGSDLDAPSKGKMYLDAKLKARYDELYPEYEKRKERAEALMQAEFISLSDNSKAEIQEFKEIENELKSIENQAVVYSSKQLALSANNVAKMSIMGAKLSVSLIDAVQGVWGNFSESTTNAKFSTGQYLNAFGKTIAYLFTGYGHKKIDKLMKLNHVDYKISELAMMGSANSDLTGTSNHPIAGMKDLFTNPKGTLATTKTSDLAFIFFRFSGLLNVLPVMIGTLMNKKTMIGGQEVSIWDAYDGDGEFKGDHSVNPYIKDGKLTKEGATIGLEIGNTIDTIHGNMSDKKPTPMNGVWYGKLLMTFKKWLPNNVEQLMSDDRTDLIEGDTKTGQLKNLYRLIRNTDNEAYVSNLGKVLYSPIWNMFSKNRRTKLEGFNQLNSDQLVRLGTKVYAFAFLSMVFNMLVSSVDDDDDEKVVYDDESNQYKKIRKQKADYTAKWGNYVFNTFHKSLRDLNPLSPILSLPDSSVPLISYGIRLERLIVDQIKFVNGHVEMTYDDLYERGMWEKRNKKFINTLDMIPIIAGLKKEFEYSMDPNKYKPQ